MTKSIVRKPRGGKIREGFHLAHKNPYQKHGESEAALTWEYIKNGLLTPRKLALMNVDGIMDVTMFHTTFGIVSDPMHPKNNWRSAVEKVRDGNQFYFRLVDAISVPAMNYWKTHGHPPPYEWAIFDSNEDSTGNSSNPYPPTHKLHAVFDLASEWITPSELFDKILKLPNVNRKYASALLHNIGSPARNGNRSRKAVKDGGKMVRAVRIG